jgi:hypothetical protein
MAQKEKPGALAAPGFFTEPFLLYEAAKVLLIPCQKL